MKSSAYSAAPDRWADVAQLGGLMEVIGWERCGEHDLDSRFAADLHHFASLLRQHDEDDLRTGGFNEDIEANRRRGLTLERVLERLESPLPREHEHGGAA